MLSIMENINEKRCECGKIHSFTSKVYSGKGAIEKLGGVLKEFETKKAFVFADINTAKVGMDAVLNILNANGIKYTSFVFSNSPKPDERAVGSVAMHCPQDSDTVIAIGSGVINDIGKMLVALGGKKYVIIATAPSMDGYASNSSSMCRDGLKVSLSSKSADVIIGDTDILKTAPVKMFASGLGDMLAKYVSLCEWEISNIITGEYYCKTIADLTSYALSCCLSVANSINERSDAATEAIFNGLIIGSAAMNYAGISRPASGVEHYISHIVDMRNEEFGTPADLHGIQCAIGTYMSVKLYEQLKSIVPDKEKALKYAESFDISNWNDRLRALLGKGAESMINLERSEGKYDKAKHRARLELILSNYRKIMDVIESKLPKSRELDELYVKLGIPISLTEIGIEKELLPEIFRASKDIRDKYVLPRLLWDLGIIDEFANTVE